MDICGYIYLYDIETNRQDILKISVYNCKSISDITDETCVRDFIFDKRTQKLISANNDFSYVSYLMLCEIAATAIELDKLAEYPVTAEFNLDHNGNPYIKVHNTCREIFPLPNKSDVYMKNKVYLNITDRLVGSECTSVLRSSLIVNFLNFIALRDGFVRDWVFAAVCGRVFVNGTYIAESVMGRARLKSILPKSFALLKNRFAVVPSRLSMKHYKIAESAIINNNDFTNPFHKLASTAFEKLAGTDYDIFSAVESPEFLVCLSEEIEKGFSEYFGNLVWQGVVKSYDDFDHITYDDLLSLKLPYGRDMLKYHMINNRKFFNQHKNRKIAALFSNGEFF